jgi:hypothetical protein
MFGNVIYACKVITDPTIEAKEYYYQIKNKAGENIGTKGMRSVLGASEKDGV